MKRKDTREAVEIEQAALTMLTTVAILIDRGVREEQARRWLRTAYKTVRKVRHAAKGRK